MLDIKFIQENKDIVIAGAKKKHVEVDIDRLIELDDKRKELQQAVEARRAEQIMHPKKSSNCSRRSARNTSTRWPT